ncbi:hypothetical protein L596_021782 [Steinernema carpocapsae]|uniref:Uncharacterized protein n=1 Tax=Steinernema carpocapsae TaxID=34508 RepID=A0A4U5MJS0_STECR|nr:hypothetical protein L596_021782 [Steinernema carpocapsae]
MRRGPLLLLAALHVSLSCSCRLVNVTETSVPDVLEHIRKGRIALHELSKFGNASRIPELSDTVARITLDWPVIRADTSEGKMLMQELQEIRTGLSQLLQDYQEFTYELECPLHPSYYDNHRSHMLASYDKMRLDWAPPAKDSLEFQLCEECWDIYFRLTKYEYYMDRRFCTHETRTQTRREIAKADLTLMVSKALLG